MKVTTFFPPKICLVKKSQSLAWHSNYLNKKGPPEPLLLPLFDWFWAGSEPGDKPEVYSSAWQIIRYGISQVVHVAHIAVGHAVAGINQVQELQPYP